MRVYFLSLLAACLLVSTAAAQKSNHELGLLLGVEFIPGQTINVIPPVEADFGRSVVFNVNYAYRLAGDRTRFYIEFPFAAAPNHVVEPETTGLSDRLATLFITPSLRLQFANDASLSPWISGGAGYGLYEGSELLVGGTPNPDRREHVFTAQFGAGIDIRTPIRVFAPIALRAEVRDYYTASTLNFGAPSRSGSQHNVIAAGGFVLKF